MTKDEKKENQTEPEFFALVATGRNGVRDMIGKMGDEIWSVAPATMAEMRDSWFQRAFVTIVNNEKLAPVLATRAGIFSVYKCLIKAATLGLQLGGQFTHCHLVPFKEKAELIIAAEGFRHSAVNGPAPVLSDAVVNPIYEGENFKIDFSAAKVEHSYDGKAERGKLLGVYGIMTRTNGKPMVFYMTRTEIEQVRNGHSVAWKKDADTPWKTDFDMMAIKTATKRFLKPFAAESEGLAMLYAQDQEPEIDTDKKEPPPPMRDVTDRVADRLDKAADALKPTDPPSDPPADTPADKTADKAEEKPPADPPADKPKNEELF